MYRGFDLTIAPGAFKAHVSRGREVREATAHLAEASIESCKNNSGDLVASKLMSTWFPQVNAHVFISHSHRDNEDVLGLAGWLKDKFGLDAFVDSSAWGYADTLLKKIDKEYCYKEDTKTYDYGRRNLSTAHVHMMLTSALMRLIDSTECVFFLNTPNSTTTDKHLSEQTTESPWLYSELLITSLIRSRSRKSHRKGKVIAKALREDSAALESMNIEYEADTSHLLPLSMTDLTAWAVVNPEAARNSAASLDTLYDLKPYT